MESAMHSMRRLPCEGFRSRVLLNRAADLGKYVVRIGADQPDRAHDNHQNHSQHHCIFRNVLTLVIVPKLP
jgi:hypothetical protein